MSIEEKILVVDDELGPREALRLILQDEYKVWTASNGREARALVSDQTFDVIILDIRMPDANGNQLLEEIKSIYPDTQVVMITAYASVESAAKALRGDALDYLVKPFGRDDVVRVVKRGFQRRRDQRKQAEHIEALQVANESLQQEVNRAYRNIRTHYADTVSSLIAAIDAKDSYTKGHQERMARFAVELGNKIGLSNEELQQLRQAALLHDLGKIGVTEDVLCKKGPLSMEEFQEVKKHPVIGAEIISRVQFLQDVVPLVLHHHERFEGSGYPNGISGVSIPQGARIIAVLDAIDAMLSHRPYRAPLSLDSVKAELQKHAGSQFDPEVVGMVLEEQMVETYSKSIRNK